MPVRTEARSQQNNAVFRILASDHDGGVLKKARQNAVKAGVADHVAFQKLPLEEFRSQKKYGCIISNPPYGVRIGESRDVETLYRNMGAVFSKLDGWSFFVLTAYSGFKGWSVERPTETGNSTMVTSSAIFTNILGHFHRKAEKRQEERTMPRLSKERSKKTGLPAGKGRIM